MATTLPRTRAEVRRLFKVAAKRAKGKSKSERSAIFRSVFKGGSRGGTSNSSRKVRVRAVRRMARRRGRQRGFARRYKTPIAVGLGGLGTAALALGVAGRDFTGIPSDATAGGGKFLGGRLKLNADAMLKSPGVALRVAAPLIAGAVVPPLLERLPLIGGVMRSAKRRLRGIKG